MFKFIQNLYSQIRTRGISKYKLEIIVFTSGALVMILEVVGSRVLAPGFGTSTIVWSSIIGVILGSLSLGYWLGGIISDKETTLEKLSKIVLYAGLSVLIMNIMQSFVVSIFSGSGDVRFNSFITSILLFSPSSILLGMVSPYTVKLKLKSLKETGETVGTLYALSTLGSITGTFLAGFVLIALLGTTKILTVLAIGLIVLSIYTSTAVLNRKLLILLAAIITLISQNQILLANEREGYIDTDSMYSRVRIFETRYPSTGRPIRVMTLDKQSSSAMHLDGTDPVFEYMKYYNLGEHFVPTIQEGLLLGGAAYSYPKEFLIRYPTAHMDVVEIDPKVTQLAKKYFELPESENLTIFHEDARTFLNNNEKKYDVVYGDAFASTNNVPFHLATVEAAQKIYDSLNDEGAYLVNIISSARGPKSEFLWSEVKTLNKVFPQVYAFAVKHQNVRYYPDNAQNLVVVALKTETPAELSSPDPLLNGYMRNLADKDPNVEAILLTDDFAPVEHLVGKMLKEL